MRSVKVPIEAMRVCYNKVSSALFVCKTHPIHEIGVDHYHSSAFRRGVDIKRYEPEQVLQGIHDALFGPNTGHFTRRDPLTIFTSAGSLFTIRTGTSPAARAGDQCLRPPYAVLDKDVLDDKALQDRTYAADVFVDWPIDYMLRSGYTLWCIPREVLDRKCYLLRVFGHKPYVGRRDVHACKEVVEFDRARHVWLAMEEGMSLAEAEKSADEVARFKVAVELDFSWFHLPNMLLFLLPEDVKDPAKVMEELEKLELESAPQVDMTKMRLVPHPRVGWCISTNWYKVVPEDQQASWESDKYFDKITRLFYRAWCLED